MMGTATVPSGLSIGKNCVVSAEITWITVIAISTKLGAGSLPRKLGSAADDVLVYCSIKRRAYGLCVKASLAVSLSAAEA